MIGALNNGKIGILAFERAISSESNNVSNSTTIGHKEDVVRFEDLLYKNGYGKGSTIQTIHKNFTQGEIKKTNVNLDVAIQGKGMFIVHERGTNDIFYTRAGNFQQGEDGFLETQEKFKVLGLSPQKSQIISTDENITKFTDDYSQFITSLNINNDETVYNYNVKSTDFYKSATDDLESGNNFKSADAKIKDIELLKNDFKNKLKLLQSNFNTESIASVNQISKIDFSSKITELKNENDYLHISINGTNFSQNFDKDIQTTLKRLSDKISTAQGFTSSIDLDKNILTIESLIPGKEFHISEANINEDYIPVLKEQDALLGSGLAMLDSSRQALKKALENAGAKYLEMTNVLSYKDKSVIGKDEINLRLNALGLVDNTKGTISIDDDGFVFVKDGNNNFLVSKISTAHFRDMHGLDPKGSNLFKETTTSGTELNADDLNKLVSQNVERGNSKFSNSLTKLVFFQKAFEANSKSITVSDEFLKTAIEMKK